jgi:hypothetical protein
MKWLDLIRLAVFMSVLTALVKAAGDHLARVFRQERLHNDVGQRR